MQQSHHGHQHHQHSGHGHSHGHGQHHHQHALGRISVALFLNLFLAILQIVGGFYVNSVAILSGALHDLGDSAALGMSYYFEKMSHKNSDAAFSYGYRRFSTLAALVTAGILVTGSLWILIETIPRLWNPETPKAQEMLFLALIGLAVNAIAAWRVSKGHSLNEKVLMWHLLEDVGSWSLILIASIILRFFEVPWVDPLMAIILSAWILYNVFQHLKPIIRVFLQAVPAGIHTEVLVQKMREDRQVKDVHHVHVWTLDGEKHIFTAHVSLLGTSNLADWEKVKKNLKSILSQQGIFESTLELEDSSVECKEPRH